MTTRAHSEIAAARTPAPAERLATGNLFGVTWAARVGFAIVFIINVQCAFAFVIDPGAYAGAYELTGVAGEAAVRGLGIAFLMWNATYPLFIVRPARSIGLGWIVVAQQLIGLIGESLLLAGLPAGHEQLADSIIRFVAFDAVGLVILVGCMTVLTVIVHRCRRVETLDAGRGDSAVANPSVERDKADR